MYNQTVAILRGLRRPRYIIAAFLLLAIVVECNTAWVRDYWISQDASMVHRVPCRKWPTRAEAERIIETRAAFFKRIEEISPDYISISVGDTMNSFRRCPGKANITIWFAGRAQGEAIKAIILDDKYIFGIPYSIINY